MNERIVLNNVQVNTPFSTAAGLTMAHFHLESSASTAGTTGSVFGQMVAASRRMCQKYKVNGLAYGIQNVKIQYVDLDSDGAILPRSVITAPNIPLRATFAYHAAEPPPPPFSGQDAQFTLRNGSRWSRYFPVGKDLAQIPGNNDYQNLNQSLGHWFANLGGKSVYPRELYFYISPGTNFMPGSSALVVDLTHVYTAYETHHGVNTESRPEGVGMVV